jgi:hypothetical protein
MTTRTKTRRIPQTPARIEFRNQITDIKNDIETLFTVQACNPDFETLEVNGKLFKGLKFPAAVLTVQTDIVRVRLAYGKIGKRYLTAKQDAGLSQVFYHMTTGELSEAWGLMIDLF